MWSSLGNQLILCSFQSRWYKFGPVGTRRVKKWYLQDLAETQSSDQRRDDETWSSESSRIQWWDLHLREVRRLMEIFTWWLALLKKNTFRLISFRFHGRKERIDSKDDKNCLTELKVKWKRLADCNIRLKMECEVWCSWMQKDYWFCFGKIRFWNTTIRNSSELKFALSWSCKGEMEHNFWIATIDIYWCAVWFCDSVFLFLTTSEMIITRFDSIIFSQCVCSISCLIWT